MIFLLKFNITFNWYYYFIIKKFIICILDYSLDKICFVKYNKKIIIQKKKDLKETKKKIIICKENICMKYTMIEIKELKLQDKI